MEEIKNKVAKKIKKYLATKIEITPRHIPTYLWQNLEPEEFAKREVKWFENWVKEFEEFLRDHRSQDVQYIEAIRQDINICSCCGDNWETYYDKEEKKTLCANCGAEIIK